MLIGSHCLLPRQWKRVVLLTLGVLALGGAAAHADTQPSGAIAGTVTDSSGQPYPGVTVTATESTGAVFTTTTDQGGNFTLANLPPDTYDVSFAVGSGSPGAIYSGVQVNPGSTTQLGVVQMAATESVPAVISGHVSDEHGRPLSGMQVWYQAPDGSGAQPGATSLPDGSYTFQVSPGTYSVWLLDGNTKVAGGTVNPASGSANTINFPLGPPQVPAGTRAQNSTRDLAFLNAERRALGLPGGIGLNPRWSAECAAHNSYDRTNNVFGHNETPGKRGYTTGGAWAGESAVLAQGSWSKSANPFETAPIHLLQLYTPSLTVIGIDDSHGAQCATTFPGMISSFAADTVSTYPANNTSGIPPSEDAEEHPFVPGKFVGIPQGTIAGRELFVYLNQAGSQTVGQASVSIITASLTGPRGPVALRWVDNTTPTLGNYLTGGILIPVKPLAPRTRYAAYVLLHDGPGTISHSWSFTTARAAPIPRRHHR
jgi:hypothetical protein